MAVQINTDNFSNVAEATCHLLPCEVQFDGAANVSKYFTTTVRKDDGMTASMHGRPLNGEKVTLPSGYTGIVVHEARKRATEEEDRTFDIRSKFDELTYWNLDKPTSTDDKLHKALQWIEIANILHQPIDDEQCSQSSVEGRR